MTPGIYLAIDAAPEVKYVGRTKSLWRRWNVSRHHRYNQLLAKGDIRIAWIEISDSKLLPEIEKALINWFKPPLNGAKTERAIAQKTWIAEPLSVKLTKNAQLLKVFQQYGYEGATLARLSKATGLGKASLYHYFPKGKEEMAFSVLDYIDNWFAANIFAPLQSSSEPVDRIRGMSKNVDEFYNCGQQACLLAVLSLGDAKDIFHAQIQQALKAWIDAIAEVLIEAGIERSLYW